MKIKIIAPLLLILIALASSPSHAQDDSVVLHCKISGEDKPLIVQINRISGEWEEWSEIHQDFVGRCPFEDKEVKSVCIRTNGQFGYISTKFHENGAKTEWRGTISREDGTYERTAISTLTIEDLNKRGISTRRIAGTCDPGEAPRPKATRF